jgi:cytochrome c biogenesis protein CcdA
MPNRPSGDKPRSSTRFSLGGVTSVIAVLALLLSIVSRAAQSGSHHDWGLVGLSLGLLTILAIPIIILGLLIRYSPSSRDEERELVSLIVKALLFILLLCLSVLINRL